MRIAIYARKSAFSDKSESVHNQDRMCREYCALHFPGEHIFLNYTDEDKTGANTNRPALQKMMRDVHAGIIDLLIVYQLDRLTRDVRDYCNLSAELNGCGVHFTSVKEAVDTSTPIGEALSTLSAVFAQMERKTLSNRVYDNMMGLARAGWWTGGNLHCGYTTQRVVENGKPHTLLVPDPEKEVIKKYSPAAPATDQDALHKKEKEIESLQKKISNLSSALSINPESTAAKYIIADMESLDSQIQKKQMELAGLRANRLTAAQAEKELFEKQKEIARLVRNLDDLPPEEQNKIARSVLRKCVWDGETLFLEF